MLCLEFLYLSIIISFSLIGYQILDPMGQVYALYYLLLAGAAASIGLGLVIAAGKKDKSPQINTFNDFKR